MRIFDRKFNNVDLIPVSPLEINFYKTKTTKKLGGFKLTVSVWSIVAAAAIVVVIYPFIPIVVYKINSSGSIPYVESTPQVVTLGNFDPSPVANAVDSGVIANENQNRIIISKIGVDIDVISNDDEKYALSNGAWHFPSTSTPDNGGNSAFSAHRYQYRPPSSDTFYLLDKLVIGDSITIIWEGRQYDYKVVESKIVTPDAIEVLDPTQNPTITLITCNPLFSTKERLVVRAELIY
ncbi:MAG: hypothetical protein A3A00_01080 [Candidatus Spechtbacteria bacterium RIFCSPLOWO2_01_FULL_38_20]|nr:MAG: hypothetical protein A2728_01145 [Candidatus Spechtbacteria bacterium RIFCSPHIGHO2_01_FULL_38_11]OGZ59463.1 MAG: hypothetical protein A3E58_00780 [Candidatus Spechtbacteria bacterium RIFCSPHIGHO2_12_FULL_38_30]OGZ61148.1 MAG: hypothetical protein A3A00_01080 [Candidatus Spechtbacteria bacterium RIFCSPLOWO2_01_FULL_38_20]